MFNIVFCVPPPIIELVDDPTILFVSPPTIVEQQEFIVLFTPPPMNVKLQSFEVLFAPPPIKLKQLVIVFNCPPPITSLIPGIDVDTAETSKIMSFWGVVPNVKSDPSKTTSSPTI